MTPAPIFAPAWFTLKETVNDFRPFVPTITDQGPEGSCVAFTAVDYLNLIQTRQHLPIGFSELGVYHDTLVNEGRVGLQGVTPNDLWYVLANQGIGRDVDWPYQISPDGTHILNRDDTPPPAYYANLTKITGWHQLPIDQDNFMVAINAIDMALSEGRPVAIAIQAQEWLRHISGPLDQQEINLIGHYDTTPIGGHEMLIVGERDGKYLVQNSWGTQWGDNGYGLLSKTIVQQVFGAVVFDGFAGHDLTYTPERTDVCELYAGLMNRAPDASGLAYWVGQLGTHSLTDVAQTIYSLGVATNATDTNSQCIDNFYVNALGRHADAGGMAYWTGKLAAGETRGDVMVDIINAVAGYNGTDSSAVYSHHLFANKVAIGAYAAIQAGIDNVAVDAHAFSYITNDQNSVDLARVGIAHDAGWLA